ncbi:MAG: thioredoxin family protein [Lautropia sp.]
MPLSYCHPPSGASRWLVACLCAEWCGTCRDFRAPLARLAAQLPAHAFAWLDIEEQPDLAGEIDVETFPTMLIQDGTRILFYGPVLPDTDGLRRLLRALDENGPQPVADDAEVRALAARLAAVHAGAGATP